MAHSLISYIIAVWGSSSATLLKDLQIAQNKIVRNLFAHHVNYNHTIDIYKSLNILDVSKTYKLELGKIMFAALHDDKYSGLRKSLLELNWRHNYNTRRIDIYRLPYCRVNVNYNSPIFRAVRFWNSLPLNIRNRISMPAFTYNLKMYLLDKQT